MFTWKGDGNTKTWKGRSEKLSGFSPEGSTAEVYGGKWMLTLPNGVPIRGTAADEAAAKKAVEQAHNGYVLQQWQKGSPKAGQVWCVPLQ